jgi:hypothetical protein
VQDIQEGKSLKYTHAQEFRSCGPPQHSREKLFVRSTPVETLNVTHLKYKSASVYHETDNVCTEKAVCFISTSLISVHMPVRRYKKKLSIFLSPHRSWL